MEKTEREIRRINRLVRSDNLDTILVDKIMKRIITQEDKGKNQNKNYMGSITHIGWESKKLIKCFNKYDVDIAIKDFDSI